MLKNVRVFMGSSIKNKAKLAIFQEQGVLFDCFTFAETQARRLPKLMLIA
jgi:hypothetical protein